MTPGGEQPVTIERVRNALIVAARLVEYHGEVYAPIFERLEREMVEMQRSTGVSERARRITMLAAGALDREPLRNRIGDLV